jgi:beta-glucanase (GH16 family)
MTNRRVSVFISLALGVGFAACSDDAEQSSTGSDSGTGARAGAGGKSGDAAAGASGAGAAGSAGTASGGSSGTSTGGSGGVAGTPGTGGTGTGGSSGSSTGGSGGAGASPGNGWTQVWADEFDGAAIDSSKWEHEVNCWGGGNGEEQCYVEDAKNSFVEAGFLHIVAIDDEPSGRVSDTDPNIVTQPHSSARLRTLGRGDWKYGRVEARAKLPFGQGMWPAFWMLPTDRVYGGWAASGEIDVMEAVNLRPGANEVHGTLHYGGAWPANVHTGTSYQPTNNVWEEFHLYAIEWEEGEIRWFVDDKHYATQTEWRSDNGTYPAPFNEEFHIILNVAVGGAWPGPPNSSTTFPQEMVVDYVRVYACSLDAVTGHGCGTEDPSIQPL